MKIAITDDVDELITHNIFYTAITRGKRNLIFIGLLRLRKKGTFNNKT